MKVKCLLIGIVVLFVAGVLTTSSYAKIDPKTCVGMWLLDEGSGTTAKDSSGNKNDGTLMGGPKWVEGKFGKALEFDDGKDYFEVRSSAAFGLKEVSLTFWMYPLTAGPRGGGGSCIPVSNIVKATSLDWGFEWWNGGAFDWTLWSLGNKNTRTTVNDANKWIFVAGTYDGTTAGLYINGKLVASNNLPGLKNPGPRPFYIAGDTCGVGWGCTGGWYNGIIDEVAIFNVALAVDDILTLMNEGLKKSLNPVAVVLSGELTTTWANIKAR